MIRYAITDPKYYSLEYLKNLDNKADFVLFRDKSSKNYKTLAKLFIIDTKKFSYKKIIHKDYKLAKKLRAYGVHLTSKEFSKIKKAKDLGLFVIVSTHTIKDIKRAKALKADVVTFSPIFKTPNKGRPKGINTLQKAAKISNIKVIALGGIVTKKEIKRVKNSNVWGFASIRYFV